MKAIMGMCLLFFSFCLACNASERVINDVEFAVIDGHRLALDLYLPEGVENPPLVIWIHRGGWKAGSRKQCEIRWMTGHGFAIASISYRFTDQAIFPAQIHDCKAAVRWLRANSGRYGYSAEKIAVAGSSAGGMLAALLGTSSGVQALEGKVGGNLDHSSRVNAVIDLYGATDFVLRSKTQPSRTNEPGSVVYRLLGGAADQKTALAKMASAAYHVSSDDPPMLVFHGEKDRTVLPDQSIRIHDVYSKAGLPVELIMIPNAGHGGTSFYALKSKRKMIDFLNRYIASNKQSDQGAARYRLK